MNEYDFFISQEVPMKAGNKFRFVPTS